MTLIKGVTKATLVNPRTMIVFSFPKCGKTELVSQLDNHLIVDYDDAADWYENNAVQISSLKQHSALLKELREDSCHFKYIILDTITSMAITVANQLAVYAYNKDNNTSKSLSWDINLLEYGKGVHYVRNAMQRIIKSFQPYCDTLVLCGHVLDKAANSGGNQLSIKEIDLPGKLKNIIGLKVDAIGLLYRRETNKNYLSFLHSEEVTGGNRAKHLRNKEFLISELDSKTDALTTHWDKIFI